MRKYVCIGPSPHAEDCVQVGTPNYETRAIAECARFIELIRETLGPEPEGVELAIKSFDHDFGRYFEVVCWFETDNDAARAYAVRCEDDAPATWEG